MTESKTKGLRLTVGGAPEVPHTIPGVPGLYLPNRPVPVGGPGELDEKSAKALNDDKTVPLEVVDVPKGKVDEFRQLAENDRLEARQGNLDNARSRRLAERAHAQQQADSIEGSAE